MKDIKIVAYPVITVVLTLLVGIAALFWGRPQVDSQFNPPVSPEQTSPATSLSTPKDSPVLPQAPTARSSAPGSRTTSGGLRVSNQTDHPVRLALLAKVGQPGSTRATAIRSTYQPPAHWDFAPEEGSQRGLLLSLPQGPLQLNQGDILVVFAQDGSRRYWGPFVVGETNQPVWQGRITEWQLVLQN